MPTIWIHRVYAADILVDFTNVIDAYNYAIEFVTKYREDDYVILTNIIDMMSSNLLIGDYNNHGGCASSNGVDIAQARDLQISMINTNDTPDSHWNESGFVRVTREEALGLGISNNPDWFIPFESSKVWMKETRTMEELDAELENYMKGRVEISNF